MPSRRSYLPLKVVSVVVVIALVSAAIFYGIRLGAPSLLSKRLSPEEARQLVHDKNAALGNLENQQLSEAIAAFNAIQAELPNDPLAPRNLSVASALVLDAEGDSTTPASIAAAQAALVELERVEGESIDAHWLALHVALAAKEDAKAATQIQALLAAEPENPAAWYAKYRAAQDSQPGSVESIEALQQACTLSPENAWLRVEWLREMGAKLSDKKAGDLIGIEQQLDDTLVAVEPYAYVIKTYTRIDPLALLEEAKQKLEGGDLAAAGVRLFSLANVLLPHAAPDQQFVRRHPLEFIRQDFLPEFYAGLPAETPAPPITVTFTPLPLPAEIDPPLDTALADFDLDGRLDLITLHKDRIDVRGREVAGEVWTIIATAEVNGGTHLLAQDFDSDFDETAIAVRGSEKKPASPALQNGCPSADVDIAVYGIAGLQLFENRYDAAAKSRSLFARSDELPDNSQEITALAAADVEADGDLDFVLGTVAGVRLWSNNNEWKFSDITDRARQGDAPPQVTQIVPVDFDRDVDIDLLVASSQGSGWLENVRHGQFRWRAFEKDFPSLADASALEVVDFDGNASWDLLGATPQGLHLVTTTTPLPGVIRLLATQLILSEHSLGVRSWDYDNDGNLDILAWSADDAMLLQGEEGSGFAAPSQLNVPGMTAVAIGDVDADGDLDLATVGAQGVSLIANNGGNQNHWIDIALQAQQIKGQTHSPSGRVSPFGVGSLVELKAGRRYQAQAVAGQTTHFGLGQATQADVVRVVWLNGVPQNVVRPAADMFLCEQQVLNTSCPYLYTWDGAKFVFATDLLWNAPLGLQFAEGVIAPARDWEYLKIPGEILVPKQGHYEVQVTEELWEAVYFDEIRLIAVDHPADVQIYSNEKVGPASISQYKIHTVSQPRLPVAAQNHRGRDLLPEIVAPDGQFAKVYDRKLRQGVTEENYLELDLGEQNVGDLAQGKQITLFLTGWMFPSSTSINVGLSQGGSVAPPRPPALLVPAGEQGWKEVLPFMGFPGGKTKTIAIDLSGLLAENDPRIRIATTMELYWDHIFFTIDEPATEVRTSELPLVSADLHYRGFSRVVPDPANGPEKFLYDELAVAAKWPSMHGGFTRWGDVAPLVRESDDQLLVMAAGDEMTMRFAVPAEPLPTGWKRDFLLYSVGWDKDCNLLTVAGESAVPVPFRAMTSYPWPPDQLVPTAGLSSSHQTRLQGAGFWQAVRRHQD